jgi:hypothetical protein
MYCDIRETLESSRIVPPEEEEYFEEEPINRGEQVIQGLQKFFGGIFDAIVGRTRELAKPMVTENQCVNTLSEIEGTKRVTGRHLEGYNGLITIRTNGKTCELIAKGAPFSIDNINYFRDVCEIAGGKFITAK